MAEQAVTWGGCWRIETGHGTALIIDFDDADYGARWMRVPGEGRGTSQYDHRWNRLARCTRASLTSPGGLPVLGDGMVLGISTFNPADWWETSTVTRIERIERDALPEPEPTPEEVLRERALTFLMPSVYESWLDGSNDYLEGDRPRDVLARGQYDLAAEALAAEEQRVWGS